MKHRKMKKLLALVLALCLLAGAVPLSASAAEYSGTCGTNLKWEIAGDTLTISGEGAMADYQYATNVPWHDYSDSFSQVVVESGVTHIGENAFGFTDEILQVTLPDTLTSIGAGAFACCYSLKGITIPSGVTAIEEGTFLSCFDLAYAELPDTVTSIGDSAFSDCESLVDVEIPSGVTYIGEGAFRSSGITSATIPGSAVLGENAFSNCDDLATVELGYGITELPEAVFSGADSLKSIHIPGSVKKIAYKAFLYCTALENVTIEEGLESVDYNAFEQCKGLKDVVFPSTCTYIGLFAFYGARPTSITVLNSNCEIYDSSDTLGKAGVTTVRGYKGSTAEEYALKYGYAFEALEGEPEAPVSFTDVHEGDYFYQPVLWAVENDITAGTSATTFGPGLDCFREQAMMFLWKAAGKPQPTSSYNPFTDVKPDAYYYDAVLWAVEKNITSGVSDTKFGTGTPCTRGQIMTFLYKAAGSPSVSGNNPFRDVRQGDYFYSPVLWAVRNGITSGTSATEFSPAQSCTRGQIVTFLYKHYAQ